MIHQGYKKKDARTTKGYKKMYRSHFVSDVYWDANGNLHEMLNCNSEEVRFHHWDVKRLSRAEERPVD